MRRYLAVVLTAFLVAAGTLPALAGGNANFLLGVRNAGSEEFWGDDQDQDAVGVMVDFGRAGWPIHICLADMHSSSGDESHSGEVSERSIGVMKLWEPESSIRPYVGAGLAALTASFVDDVGLGDLVQHDSTSAFYIDGGVFWRTGERFNIGFGVRFMTQAGIEIQGVRGDANYAQAHILAGFGWPRRERRTPAPPPAAVP